MDYLNEYLEEVAEEERDAAAAVAAADWWEEERVWEEWAVEMDRMESEDHG